MAIEITRLSSKGQVIIPKSIRQNHRWLIGQEFTVEDTGEGVLLRPKSPFPRTTVEEVAVASNTAAHRKRWRKWKMP